MNNEFSHRVSFALNAILIVVVIGLALRNSASRPLAAHPEPANVTGEASLEKTTNKTVRQPDLLQYAAIQSLADRRRMIIDQLRAMGVPNDMLGLVAKVDFEVQWDGRFQECWGDMKKMAAVQLEMDQCKDAEMRAALGEEGFKQWDQGNMLWEAMSTKVEVTAAEADTVYALKKNLQQRQLELEQARVKGTMDDASIAEAQDKAYAEFNQQLKAVLGDERYAKSQQLDPAFAAGNLRYQLAAANPTDDQFQKLFDAEQQWNQTRLQLDPASPDYAAQLKALNDARDQQYQQVLGADAFNALQEAQDPGYGQMKKYETLWGLDDAKVDYVYNTMKNYEKSVQDYQAQTRALQSLGQNVDADAVSKKLQQLADQTGQALQNYLGQDSFNKLQRNHIFLFSQSAQ